MKPGTRVLHTGIEIDPYTGAASVPIYQTSTFHQESLDHSGRYEYSRSGNPTREALEQALAVLEEGRAGFAFSSGMAAISSVLCLLRSGDRVVATRNLYGGSFRVLTRLFPRFGIEPVFVDTTDLRAVRSALELPEVKAVFLESPANPLLQVTDIAAVAELCRRAGMLTVVDNTLLSPLFQKPLTLGADVVVHSATKFLGGHSDVLAGIAVVRSEELSEELRFVQNAFGAVLGPQDSWLVLRGIKTLKVRLEQQQENALIIAGWLKKRPEVTAVYYPGLEDHPGHQLLLRQASGFGAVLSFRLQSASRARRFLEALRLPVLGVSLGAVESIVTYPCRMSHAAIPPQEREALGVTEDLVRLSVGLEDVDDLLADLEQALETAARLE